VGLLAFTLAMLAEHTALHVEDRFSLPLLPLCGLSVVAQLERVWTRARQAGPRHARACWVTGGYALLSASLFVAQILAWDRQPTTALARDEPFAADVATAPPPPATR
jgi:hypothetical protein